MRRLFKSEVSEMDIEIIMLSHLHAIYYTQYSSLNTINKCKKAKAVKPAQTVRAEGLSLGLTLNLFRMGA